MESMTYERSDVKKMRKQDDNFGLDKKLIEEYCIEDLLPGGISIENL
jgi:hypothetical protein